MGSQLIMAAPNATFLHLWYNSYVTDYSEEWSYNALSVPFQLSQIHSRLIHIEGRKFTNPSWNDRHLIYHHNFDWSDNYAIHLYIRDYKYDHTFTSLCSLNTTIGAVGRHALFGNKALCNVAK